MDENELLFDDLDIPAFDPFARLHRRLRGQQGMRGGGLFDSDDDDDDEDEDEALAGADADIEDGRIRAARLRIEEDTVTYTSEDYGDVGVYQVLEQPFSVEFNYYEVEVLDWGSQGRIGMSEHCNNALSTEAFAK